MTGICFSNPAILWITEYELRIVDMKSKVNIHINNNKLVKIIKIFIV